MEHEGNDADRIDQSGPRRLSLDVGNAVRGLDKRLPRTARAWGGIIDDSAPRGSVDGVVRTS